MVAPCVLLAAGGTGGHVFPAQALAEAMLARGWRAALTTDARGARFITDFPQEVRTLTTPASSITPTRPWRWPLQFLALARGITAARAFVREIGASVAVGFGGYAAAPGIVAARGEGVPYGLHEQNLYAGRVNRRLAKKAGFVAASFSGTQGLGSKMTITGAPLRPSVAALAKECCYLPPSDDGEIRIVLTGGSQGAQALGRAFADAVGLLPQPLRARLRLAVQRRDADAEYIDAALARAEVAFEAKAFFGDLPERLAVAHLVIARAGATTLAEIAALARPSLLAPLAAQGRKGQRANAEAFVAARAALLAPRDLAPAALAERMTLALDSKRLAAMAVAAQGLAHLDALERLAGLVEGLAA